MKLNILHILLYLFICSACNSEEKFSVDYVDPFIGTGFHGHTYPGATAPFGAVQLSPDTRVGNWDACAGYHYNDTTLRGLSHTHLSGTGCIDLGDILFVLPPKNQALQMSSSTVLLTFPIKTKWHRLAITRCC